MLQLSHSSWLALANSIGESCTAIFFLPRVSYRVTRCEHALSGLCITLRYHMPLPLELHIERHLGVFGPPEKSSVSRVYLKQKLTSLFRRSDTTTPQVGSRQTPPSLPGFSQPWPQRFRGMWHCGMSDSGPSVSQITRCDTCAMLHYTVKLTQEQGWRSRRVHRARSAVVPAK